MFDQALDGGCKGLNCCLQDMAKEDGSQVQTDASGNPILKDIGLYLRGVFRKQLDVRPPASPLQCMAAALGC